MVINHWTKWECQKRLSVRWEDTTKASTQRGTRTLTFSKGFRWPVASKGPWRCTHHVAGQSPTQPAKQREPITKRRRCIQGQAWLGPSRMKRTVQPARPSSREASGGETDDPPKVHQLFCYVQKISWDLVLFLFNVSTCVTMPESEDQWFNRWAQRTKK